MIKILIFQFLHNMFRHTHDAIIRCQLLLQTCIHVDIKSNAVLIKFAKIL